ncbi:MAG: LytTR family DNA-binding domain-containing protein [Clostridia bacterium]|nr:LytTR family DNA-binding domain-containing protein [Clostridia bacterium]
MIHIAIVEDETEHADRLAEFVEKYAEEIHASIKITRFGNAVSLIDGYKADYDLIFLDIKMPYLDGMDAAHKLRELDRDVLIVFVTSMRQYALAGYAVDAADFLVKPIEYADFSLKMARIFKRLVSRTEKQNEIILSVEQGVRKLKASDIRYVETDGHNIIYRLVDGTTITQYSSMKAAEARFAEYGFARCNTCYLVNLHHVRSVKGLTVDVDGEQLQISQPRRKPFLDLLVKFAEDGEL